MMFRLFTMLVFNTRQFDEYTNELTQCLEDVCKIKQYK